MAVLTAAIGAGSWSIILKPRLRQPVKLTIVTIAVVLFQSLAVVLFQSLHFEQWFNVTLCVISEWALTDAGVDQRAVLG